MAIRGREDLELVAWSYIDSGDEALCVWNRHPREARGTDVIVDAALNPLGACFTVIQPWQMLPGGHILGVKVPVVRTSRGTAYVELRNVPASALLALTNSPDARAVR